MRKPRRNKHPSPSIFAFLGGRWINGVLHYLGYAYHLHPTKGWRRSKLR